MLVDFLMFYAEMNWDRNMFGLLNTVCIYSQYEAAEVVKFCLEGSYDGFDVEGL